MTAYNRDSKLTYPIHKVFSERIALSTLGHLEQALKKGPCSMVLDFSRTMWADPQGLLMLGCIIANHPECKIEINLGGIEDYQYEDGGHEEKCQRAPGSSTDRGIVNAEVIDEEKRRHAVFLKFLHQFGFLAMYCNINDGAEASNSRVHQDIKVTLDAGSRQLTLDWRQMQDTDNEIYTAIRIVPFNLHMSTELCLTPRLVRIKALRGYGGLSQCGDEGSARREFVEQLLHEAGSMSSSSGFNANSYLKERMFQKMRRILSETLDNAAEHAYPGEEHKYIGVFARLHKAPESRRISRRFPSDLQDLNDYVSFADLEHRIPTVSQRNISKAYDWLELCICDAGVNLLYHEEEWIRNGNYKPAKKDKMRGLLQVLFSHPLSRYSAETRENEGRTTLTGLRDIGFALGIDQDNSRIFSKDTWIAHNHPCSGGRKQEDESADSHTQASYFIVGKTDLDPKLRKFTSDYKAFFREDEKDFYQLGCNLDNGTSTLCAPGVALTFSMSLPKEALTHNDRWIEPSHSDRNYTLDALLNTTFSPSSSVYTFFDAERDGYQTPPYGNSFSYDDPVFQEAGIIVVRPSRKFTKQHISRWLRAVALGDPRPSDLSTHTEKLWAATTLVFAELTPFQALHFESVILEQQFAAQLNLRDFRILLVKRDWQVRFIHGSYDPVKKLVVYLPMSPINMATVEKAHKVVGETFRRSFTCFDLTKTETSPANEVLNPDSAISNPDSAIVLKATDCAYTKILPWVKVLTQPRGQTGHADSQLWKASTLIVSGLSVEEATKFANYLTNKLKFIGEPGREIYIQMLLPGSKTMLVTGDVKSGSKNMTFSSSWHLRTSTSSTPFIFNATSFFTLSIHQKEDLMLTPAGRIARLLRQKDSQDFWKDIRPPLFHNGEFVWNEDAQDKEATCASAASEKTLTGHEGQTKQKRSANDGYATAEKSHPRGHLPFANAVANYERHRICANAVRRCLELLGELNVEVTDEAAKSILAGLLLRRGLPDAHNADSSSVLFSGVIFSGNTIISHLLQKDSRLTRIVSLFIHPEARFSQKLDEVQRQDVQVIPALLWLPSPKLKKEEEIQARIKGTQYLAKYGSKSIPVITHRPSIDEPDKIDFSRSYYGRTKAQTYQDFHFFKCLRLQHTLNGHVHDILSLNCQRIFDASGFRKGELRYWLLQRLEDLDKNNNNVTAMVYPSHFSSEYIISSFFKAVHDMFPDKLKKIKPISVTFLKDEQNVPLRVSPTSELELMEYFAIAPEGQKKDDQIETVVIFDDGVITGKHLHSIENFLKAKETEKKIRPLQIHTITVVDRTGVPLYQHLLEEFAEKNSRFWRFDVPPVGTKNNCIMCEGLKAYQGFLKKIELSPELSGRLNTWSQLWSVNDIYLGWGTGGSNAQDLPEVPDAGGLRVGTLEMYVDENGESQRNTFPLYNSTNSATFIAELTRLTTHADKACERAEKFLHHNPAIAIEILAVQYLLYESMFSYFEKLTRLRLMVEAAYALDRPVRETAETQSGSSENSSVVRPVVRRKPSDITPLIGLCFASLDERLAKHLWEDDLLPLLDRSYVLDIDLRISIGYLQWAHSLSVPEKMTPRQHHNLIACGTADDFSYSYYQILNTLGGRNGDAHRTDLYRLFSANQHLGQACQIRDYVKELLPALSYMEKHRTRDTSIRDFINKGKYISKLWEELNGCLDRLLAQGLALDTALEADKHNDALEIIAKLNDALYRKMNDNLFYWFKQSLILECNPKSGSGQVRIVDVVKNMIGDVQSSVDGKEGEEGDGQKSKPKFVPYDIQLFDNEYILYFGMEVRDTLKYVIDNAKYAREGITRAPSCAKDAIIPFIPTEKDRICWYTASLSDKKQYLTVTFVNACDSDNIQLKPFHARYLLEYVGGSVTHKVNSEEGVRYFTITVTIPLAEHVSLRRPKKEAENELSHTDN